MFKLEVASSSFEYLSFNVSVITSSTSVNTGSSGEVIAAIFIGFIALCINHQVERTLTIYKRKR